MTARALFLFAAALPALAQTGQWYPHEGGLLKYRVNIRFGEEPDTMPDGWKFGRVSAVAVDSGGNVYVFHRGKKADPLVVFDAKGNYLRSWGKGVFANPHGARFDREGNLWLIDNGDHTIRKCTPEGKVLLTLGTPGKSGESENAFYRPTDIAFARDGGFYITDGYGNSRVVQFDSTARFVRAWGRKGTGPGEFNTPHVIQIDSKGRLYVSDRENNRIQVFDAQGKLLKVWTHLGATQGNAISPRDEMWIITHRNNIENLTYDTLAGRIMKIDLETGRILGAMESPGHWIALAPGGEIFIGSLTGNVFRFYPGWLDHGLGVDEGQQPKK
jgi:DNA-binding beta-propeller fold protein YncE